MQNLFKALFLLGCLTVATACTTIYKGEITDQAASEERTITAANGQSVDVRVDVYARDTTRDRTAEEDVHIGTRYVSQITYTYPDGTQERETEPKGTLHRETDEIHFRSTVQKGESSGLASGSRTVEDALQRAWSRASARLTGTSTLPYITPSESIDAMLGAVDAVTN